MATVPILVPGHREGGIVGRWIGNVTYPQEHSFKELATPLGIKVSNGSRRVDKVPIVEVMIIVETIPKIKSWVRYSRAIGVKIVTTCILLIEEATTTDETTPNRIVYKWSDCRAIDPDFHSRTEPVDSFRHFLIRWKGSLAARDPVGGIFGIGGCFRAHVLQLLSNQEDACQLGKHLARKVRVASPLEVPGRQCEVDVTSQRVTQTHNGIGLGRCGCPKTDGRQSVWQIPLRPLNNAGISKSRPSAVSVVLGSGTPRLQMMWHCKHEQFTIGICCPIFLLVCTQPGIRWRLIVGHAPGIPIVYEFGFIVFIIHLEVCIAIGTGVKIGILTKECSGNVDFGVIDGIPAINGICPRCTSSHQGNSNGQVVPLEHRCRRSTHLK
mmetsp:Transcript_927/g.2258  ORF Transcript_927/g.2258 Transcript_927/m.2258 type:complete len:381 (-) Transcript_927:277-1419(-)